MEGKNIKCGGQKQMNKTKTGNTQISPKKPVRKNILYKIEKHHQKKCGNTFSLAKLSMGEASKASRWGLFLP